MSCKLCGTKLDANGKCYRQIGDRKGIIWLTLLAVMMVGGMAAGFYLEPINCWLGISWISIPLVVVLLCLFEMAASYNKH